MVPEMSMVDYIRHINYYLRINGFCIAEYPDCSDHILIWLRHLCRRSVRNYEISMQAEEVIPAPRNYMSEAHPNRLQDGVSCETSRKGCVFAIESFNDARYLS